MHEIKFKTKNLYKLKKLNKDGPIESSSMFFNILIFVVQNVASRGLDLPDVRWIVQYTTPGAVQDYVHRVGRTARVGKQGHALLFIMPAEVQYLKSLAGHGIR